MDMEIDSIWEKSDRRFRNTSAMHIDRAGTSRWQHTKKQ